VPRSAKSFNAGKTGIARDDMMNARDRSDLLQDRKAGLTEGHAMISSVDEATTTGITPGLGSDLRMARERLGWALPDVALNLRVRLVFLVAIEEGRFGALPGHTYALGFVRSYAKLLGLDTEEITRRFRNEARDLAGRTALEFPAPVPDRGVPAGAVVFLGCVLAIAAYIGWYHVSGERTGSAVVETVPDRLAPLATLSLAPPPRPVPVAPVAPAPVEMTPAQMGLPSYPPISAGAAMPPPFFSVARPTPFNSPAPPPAGQSSSVTNEPIVSDDSRIIIRARVDSWVQVRDKAGQTLLNRVLRPGESYSVPPKQQLSFTTGNAGGVDLIVDGVAAPSLGGNGVVRRDLPLDPDTIRNGKTPVQRPVSTPQ
jgi:cytoskeleton protein RodZ